MSDKLEKMRLKQQGQHVAETVSAKPKAEPKPELKVEAPKKPAQPPRPKVSPPIVATESVMCVCGHTGLFGHFADKQDKFRKERREKFAGRKCPTCRGVPEVQIGVQAPKPEPVKGPAPTPSQPKKRKRPVVPEGYRHPHGTNFNKTWDAEAHLWTGTLTIPGVPPITVTNSGSFPVEMVATIQYFGWMKRERPDEWKKLFPDKAIDSVHE